VLTWAQLGLHARPVGLLDVAGYYQPLAQFFDQAVGAGFLRPAHRALLLVGHEPSALLDRFEAWRGPALEHVIDRASS
jgi:predicted Rossmann-fold nucleotide-binding protein